METAGPSPLELLVARLGHRFNDRGLLDRALTHPSYLHEHPDVRENNQRLEFLGDAVLQLLLTEALFELFPAEREGGLSKRRAALTKGAFLTELALESGIDACLRLGSSEEATGGRTRASALEDAFEALVGAIYLDGGLPAAKVAVRALYGKIEDRLASVGDAENPKGRLQELLQPIHGNHALRYDVLSTEGADHARAFEIAVYLTDREIGRGRGPSKKLAEEAAARQALATLGAEQETGTAAGAGA
jgi:ribonuclease-3